MFRRVAALQAAFVLLLGLIIPVIAPVTASASGTLTNRSLSISSSAIGTIATGNPGSGGNGQKAKHTVTFTFGSTAPTDGSILIMYCTNPVPQAACTTPGGMTAQNLTGVTVTSPNSSLTSPGGYSIDTTTANSTINTAIGSLGVCNGSGTTRVNCVALKRASGQAETGTPQVKIDYGGGASDYITNPDNTSTTCLSSSNNCPFYARVFVFSDTAWTAANLVDAGGVAASTAQQITITAKVPERLEFSVGTTPTNPSTNCSPFTDNGALSLGDPSQGGVLSTAVTYDAHSYFRINSNATFGTAIYYSGDTLKSGSNSISPAGTGGPPPTTAVASAVGTSQFGLAIDQSDTDPGGNTGWGYSFTNLTKTAPYDTGHGTITNGGTALFAFGTGSVTSPIQIASSTGAISCDTGSVRYIGNVATNTPAGIYTTTITYIATATY